MLIEVKEKPKQVSDAETAAEIFRSILSADSEVDQDKEHFWVMGLNTNNVILYVELVSLGTLNNSLICPRETFKMAIIKAAASIIVGHNHPSGDPGPSREDSLITDRLKQAGKILGIELLDHIIIGNNQRYFSFSGKWSAIETMNTLKNKNSWTEKEVMEMGKVIEKGEVNCETKEPEKLKAIRDIKVGLKCQKCGAEWPCILKTDNSTSKDSRKCPNGCNAKIEADVTLRNVMERYNL